MKQLCFLLIRFYQKFISPLIPSNCPYTPSCSHYMMGAIEEHGVIKGILLGTWRILRCNPFTHGGYDPVPYNMKKIKWVL